MTQASPSYAPPASPSAPPPALPKEQQSTTDAGAPTSQTFSWNYTALTISATLTSNELTCKQGLRTFKAKVSEIRHVYVQTGSSSDYVQLLVGYEPSPGKKKVIRLMADTGALGMKECVETLVRRFPYADRRSLPEAEALKMMGAANTELIGLFVAVVLIPALVGIFTLPMLLHGLDTGHAELSLAELSAGKDPGTLNLTVTRARASVSNAIVETTTHYENGVETGTSTRLYVPIVTPDWTPDKPISLVLKTPELDKSELNQLVSATAFEGVKRSILWEGLDSDAEEYFTGKSSLKLSPDLVLLEYGSDVKMEFYLSLGITGLVFVIMASVGGFMFLQRQKNLKQG